MVVQDMLEGTVVAGAVFAEFVAQLLLLHSQLLKLLLTVLILV